MQAVADAPNMPVINKCGFFTGSLSNPICARCRCAASVAASSREKCGLRMTISRRTMVFTYATSSRGTLLNAVTVEHGEALTTSIPSATHSAAA